MINFIQEQISNPNYDKTTVQSVEGSVVLLGLNSQGQPITFHGNCASAGKQGAQGSAGSPGASLSVFKFQYYLSTSMTTPTGGSWSDTPPTMSTGYYMWIRPVWKIGQSGSTQEGQPCCCGSGAGGGGGTGWESVTADDVREKLFSDAAGFMDSLKAAMSTWNLNINQMNDNNSVTIGGNGISITNTEVSHTTTITADSIHSPIAYYI